MSIKFVCTCGKKLRARDEMAARRSVCPRCGSPVGIPSLKPTQRGTAAAPLTPLERQRAQLHAHALPHSFVSESRAETQFPPAPPSVSHPIPVPAPEPIDPAVVRLVASRKFKGRFNWRRPREHLETAWHHCLLYPVRALPLILGAAAAMTFLSGAVALIMPFLGELTLDPLWPWFVCAPSLLLPLIILGYVGGFLECTLSTAAAGYGREVRWPGRKLGMALKSVLTWMICFLAGPLLPAAMLLIFVTSCGELGVIDWLIVIELSSLAVGLWLFNLLAATRRDRWRDAHPGHAIELAWSLGWPGVLVTLLLVIHSIGHGWWMLLSLELLHSEPLEGSALLLACWISGLLGATFLFRWLGVAAHWAYWANRSQAVPPTVA